jgi:hypothetical protein
MRLSKAIINISPQRMQWYLPLMRNFTASYLSTAKSTGAAYSYPLSPSLQGAKYCLLHRPAESNTTLNLLSYRPSYQIGIKFRLLNLKNIELNPLSEEALKVEPQFINSLPSPPDDHARSGGMDSYRYLIRLAVNLHQGDTSFSISGLNNLAKLQVFL